MQKDFSLICSGVQILMSEGVLCSEVVYAGFLLPDFVCSVEVEDEDHFCVAIEKCSADGP